MSPFGDWFVVAGAALGLSFILLGWPPSRRRGAHFGALAVCVGGVAAGFLTLGREYSAVAGEAWAWRPTSASVWKSQRIEPPVGTAGESRRFEIGYLYEVDGKTYSGDTLTLGAFEESDTTAQSLTEAFPVGRKITIYYDPADPRRSVVWRGGSNVGWIAQVVGAVLAIPAVGLAWLFVRRWRAATPGSSF